MRNLEPTIADHALPFYWLEMTGLFFLALIAIETVWDFSVKNRQKPNETFANFIIGAVNILLDNLGLGILFIFALYFAEPLALFDFSDRWWFWPAAILCADFLYYWLHRWEHEIRILWAYHSVHHSSPEFNLTTSLRLSWVEGLIEWVFFLPMIILGFDAVETLLAIGIVVQYQTWIHTEKIGKLGWLDKILNTPSTHRVHHASNPEYIDKNYGGILIIWDHLFGTYKAEGNDLIYGITEPLGTSNPISINFREFSNISRECFRTKGLSKKLRVFFGPPGG